MSKKINFEKSLENLEKLVQELESGELTLEESLEHFEKGVTMYKDCKQVLDTAQKKISELTEAMKVDVLEEE
jgi:exodeoxyribonuclease VII small subunit